MNPRRGTSDPVALTVQEIEDAGVREVLQVPGASFGSWNVLNALLDGGSWFTFKEPLGQAREVKVALSGLFGRFVARAYLERYLSLSIFSYLGRIPIVLDGGSKIQIEPRSNGDFPDWIASTGNLSNLTVVEAKGSHDAAGPQYALNRAWKQAGRIDVVADGLRLTVKRLAIVTRWGTNAGGPACP